MDVLNVEQIRKAEVGAIAKGMSELELMQRAGDRAAEEIIEAYQLDSTPKRTVVLCGEGKNGGDGFVIARRFFLSGCPVAIVLAKKRPAIPEPAEMLKKAEALGIALLSFEEAQEEASLALIEADVVVDCVFGIGFHGVADEYFSRLFRMVNSTKGKVASVDAPSGLNCDTGKVEGECVRADLTIAITALKVGHVTTPGSDYCGQLRVISIDLPGSCLTEAGYTLKTIEKDEVRALLPGRRKSAHKGDFGRVLSICGSRGMPGAAALAATGAVRAGAGLVTCVIPKSAYIPLASHLVEPTFCSLPENEKGTLNAAAMPRILEQMDAASVILLGCGLGHNADTEYLVDQVLHLSKCPVVLDADGINALGSHIDILKAVNVPVILTPHPGELGRLLGLTAAEVQANRIRLARQFVEDYPVTLALKGSGTLVAGRHEDLYVNTTGNPGMARGGSGDLLAGMIAGLLAQGLTPFDAARAAVYLHGLAGDSAAGSLSQRGMTPSDMAELLPLLLLEFEQ